MADPSYLDDYKVALYNTVARTINEQGNIEVVGEDDLADWLADNQHLRPEKPDGSEWTLADEQAAVAQYDEKKDYGDDRPVWDTLAHQAGIIELDTLDERAGGVGQEQVDALLSQSPSEDFVNEWSVETAKKGGEEDRVYQEMPEEEAERQALQSAQWSALLAQSAARKALMEEKGKGKGERKRLSSPEIQDLFRDDAAVLYGEEQDPQALGAERAVETWGRVERYGKQAQKRAQKAAEKDEQAEYRADQRTMATPGYGKSIDNPFGKK